MTKHTKDIEDSIKAFESMLGLEIKDLLSNYISAHGYIDISATYSTKQLFDDILMKYDISVFGMSINQATFSITFEFGNSYKNTPYYIQKFTIEWDNYGEYEIELTESSLNSQLHLTLDDTRGACHSINCESIQTSIVNTEHQFFILKLSS